VVGASSTGIACALVLAQQGRRVRILEARTDPRSEPGRRALAACADEVARANDLLATGDHAGADTHFRAADSARSSVWGSRNRNLLFDSHALDFLRGLDVRVGELAPLTIFETHLGAAQPSICIRYGERGASSSAGRLDAATMIAQRDPVAVAPITVVEGLLRDAAEASPNITLDYDAPVLACPETADGVSAIFGAADRQAATADLLVIADGAGRRALSRSLGIDRIEKGAEHANIAAFLCDLDGHVLGHPLREAWVDARATPQGWVVFLNSGKGLLTVNTRRVVGATAPTAVQLAVAAGVTGKLVEQPADFSFLLDRAARFTNSARTVIVGDAACRTSPAWAFGAQFALLWAQMVGDLSVANRRAPRAAGEPLAAFAAEAERVTNMRLEFEHTALRLVDFANAGVRAACDDAIPTNLLSAIDRTELNFEAADPRGGKMTMRFGIDLEELVGGTGNSDVAAFWRAVGRVDVEGLLDLKFEGGGGKSMQTRAAPLDYRTHLGTTRVAGGTVSMQHHGAGYWVVALDSADLHRSARRSGDVSIASIERAELRLPDEFVTELIQRIGPRLWTLGALRKQPLCFDMQLREGEFAIGTFKLQLQGSPLIRVTVTRRPDAVRFGFKMLRGQASAEQFSRFVRQTPLGVTRPLRLWQALLGGFADPFVDFWAASTSRWIREVNFDVRSDGTGIVTYDMSGLPLRVPMSETDVRALIAKLFSSASCEQIMRQYQHSVLAARTVPVATSGRS
jgi:2-polyprenyl-6-methoxyphenol hydroxylase-like FAD-dependent oxidoreductase